MESMSQTQRIEKRADRREARRDVGDQIAAARAMNGRMSQDELATKLTRRLGWGVNRQAISDMELGKAPIHVEVLKAVRAELGGSYEFYMDGIEGYPGNTPAGAGGAIPRYLKPRTADVIDIHTRERLAN